MLGAQQPRIRLWPTAGVDRRDGQEACDLAAGYGLTADEWQADVTTAWLARRRDGRLAAGRCGLAVPRQNGKNGVLEIVELHKMVAQGRHILHTAHEVKTARKAFLRLKSFFENERKFPELAALVKEIRQTNGQEAIVLHARTCDRRSRCGCTGGASIEFVARSRGSGRGFTVDDLVCDEAQELTDEQLEALMPTISAAPSGDPQIIFTGTPPPPNGPGTVFLRVRAEGVAGKDKRLCWDEWSIPDDADVIKACADPRSLPDTNPALGRRLNKSTTDDERKVMSAEGFARERYGKWPRSGARVPPTIAADLWDSRRGPALTIGKVGVGVKFAPDGSRVACVIAVKQRGGRGHVAALGEWPIAQGVALLGPWISARKAGIASVVIDGRSGAGVLVESLRTAKVSSSAIVQPTVAEAVTAYSMLLTDVESGDVTHSNQPGMNASVACSTQRKIGRDGWGWEPIGDGSCRLVEAASLALWGATTSKRTPGRKMRGRVL